MCSHQYYAGEQLKILHVFLIISPSMSFMSVDIDIKREPEAAF